MLTAGTQCGTRRLDKDMWPASGCAMLRPVWFVVLLFAAAAGALLLLLLELDVVDDDEDEVLVRRGGNGGAPLWLRISSASSLSM